MNLSKKWMLDYTCVNVDDKEFADEMTMSGSKVEGYETEGSSLKNIVVGRVLSIERHADSDRLWVCSIDAGEEKSVQIVTGAQNVKQGDFVPVALDNSVVNGGKEIKKGMLRGVESEGMLCALEELGLALNDFPYAEEDGIFILGEDCDKTPGMNIQSAIGLNDTITEFEITSNRPDCLSVTGLAREAAATFGVPLKIKKPEYHAAGGNVNEMLSVQIDDAENCYRYAGAVVKNVKIEPSPRWMRERLRASGIRAINNIVDITNYVMLEYGQPMHAFDLRYLEGGRVIVRRAREGEKITTLDDTERALSPEMLVIADAKKPVAVAGVMGGEFSGIMADTETIVFESACFNGVNVRTTAKKLGMRTESSARFEKGLDPNGCTNSLSRALELVEQLGAGEIVEGVVDCFSNKPQSVTIPFKPDWINKFIGINVSAAEQKAILEKLEFKVENDMISVPSFRGDVEHQADIAEEIARIYGYDKIENRELAGVADARLTPVQVLEKEISSTLLALGLSEIQTYSFVSPKVYDKLRVPAESPLRNGVVISNPLGEDTSTMRTLSLPSMLEILSRNYNFRNKSAKLFELAKEYKNNGTEMLPDEKVKIVLGMYGESSDFFTLKGIVEELLCEIGAETAEFEAVCNNAVYHPGRCAEIFYKEKSLGILGEIHPDIAEEYEIGERVYAAVIDFETVFELREIEKAYKPLPKFPSMSRDLAFVCKKETAVGELKKIIQGAADGLLEKIELFDVYEGEQIPSGMKSVAFSLTLRSHSATLTDEQADSAVKAAISALTEKGISLR